MISMTFPTISLQPARQSHLCDLPVKIIFVRPEVIGIHEDHNPAKLEIVLESILTKGYEGAAILAMPAMGNELFNQVKHNTNCAAVGDLEIGVIDGHNRLVACKIFSLLNILNHALIPVQLIPMPSDLVFAAVHPSIQEPFTLQNIQEINATVGKTVSAHFPYHTRIRLQDGSSARVVEGQPNIQIALPDLLNFATLDMASLATNAEAIARYIPVDKLKKLLTKVGLG